ncbi:hypothetical protein SteCoe_10175 [Stentor coeruleus]|uniref:UBC core domain-containing protein n=1 Tax=Stentor coeruleus TaxID=5963 RepID=A0A1R2CGC0_9CILI|nr:hypothetical protein SteCoe_10175 [Stentor coeruleus]
MASDSYSSDIQQKRFDKELKLLANLIGVKAEPRRTPFGVIIRIIYSKYTLHNKEIQFDLYLEGKYPFQAPRLLCESVFSFPSVSDGRDLLGEILKQKWTPSITSADIINMIPDFFKNTLLPLQKELQNKDFGKFHLGSPYHLDIWEKKEAMGTYYSLEIDPRTGKTGKERVIVVTHTIFLQFDLNSQVPGIGYLDSWATLQSLNMIKRSRQEPDRITFEWKKIENIPAYVQNYKIAQASELIDLVSRNMQKIGAIVKKNGSSSVYNEDDVNGKAIKKMKINEILQAIEVYEDNLEEKMNIEIINSLMQLYQQAIEYFAAVSNPQYDIFLQRMHMLLSNENVLAVLQGKTNEKKQEIIGKNVENQEEGKKELIKSLDSQEKNNEKNDMEKIEEASGKDAVEKKIQENYDGGCIKENEKDIKENEKDIKESENNIKGSEKDIKENVEGSEVREIHCSSIEEEAKLVLSEGSVEGEDTTDIAAFHIIDDKEKLHSEDENSENN